ncbi:MAG: hypothetical protein M0Z46_18125 [Actinomycetota bacterium]|jgi:hypothetical protein|nr:hypothetical protein [Actinomycetota bacterium]
MTTCHEAPGLTADWLNGWLAAIGATVLVPQLSLRWTDEVVPSAVFQGDVADVVQAVADALPTEASLDESVIARSRDGFLDFSRNVSLEAYRERAAVERETHSSLLAASVSDLREDADLANLEHGAFDPPAPRGETLWSRARKCAGVIPVDQRVQWVRQSLEGLGQRRPLNGLGFDARRLVGSADPSEVFADPVIELLCFEALALFPTRGDGRRRIFERGWTNRQTRRGAFEWAAWRPLLDRWAIDAFLDIAEPDRRDVIGRWTVVPYQPRGDETNRAYFAERLK